MNLIIDVGNTRVKVALFKDDSLCWSDSFHSSEIILELKKINNKYEVYRAIISSVGFFADETVEEIQSMFNILVLSSSSFIPFKNNYETPETLGVDRIALAAAAVSQYPNENVLVIDTGTCITFDFVNENREYLGGAISPGIAMRYKSLNTFTSKLPLLKMAYSKSVIGNNTEESIHSGVVNGVLGEINSIIDLYKQQYEKLTIVLTGGDTNFLAKRLKNGIFANPNFLLEGLNSILTYNSRND